MDIKTLEERIAKNEVKIEKKKNTIQKKEAAITKKAAYLMKKYGVDVETFDKYDTTAREIAGNGKEGSNDIYWTMCDIDHYKEDLRRIPKEIAEIEAVVEKQKKQLAGEIAKEATFTTEIPERLIQYRDALIAEWDDFDKAKRQRLIDEYRRMEEEENVRRATEGKRPGGTEAYKAFIKKHRYAGYEFMYATDEEIHKSNEEDAKKLILNLINRVKDIVGEITDYSHLRVEPGNQGFAVITGYVVGTMGRASVETILAGGYNIQRLHVRTLVHEIY